MYKNIIILYAVTWFENINCILTKPTCIHPVRSPCYTASPPSIMSGTVSPDLT